MGVQGLWQILEPTATPVALESLEGKRIAVDISLWLHQALQGFNQYGGETRSPHLVLLINRIAKLLFYKIRPVFVFDGDQIPVFKRHLLRDRELRRYTDQLIVNKQQKRALIEAATGSQSVGETLKKKARIEDNDMFALPEDIPALPDQKQKSSSSANYKDDKFLAGYHNLISRDEKIAFLAEAKQKVKKTRLNDADIPADADDFSKFQTERLLQRNQLNNEIDMLRSEKAHQTAKVKDKAIKMVVVDAHARSHLLTKDHDSDIEVISPEKKKPTKLPWTEFVKKYKKQYDSKSGA
uniref:XPG N-terminal domain-containing protein n=1 Tax=Panagrolaimus davidi TaxID=227884 RepID=A0A914PA31_9BILA